MKKLKTTGELKDDKPKPNEPCVKCGSVSGWSGPLYVPSGELIIYNRDHPSKVRRIVKTSAERLAWTCLSCGFRRFAPTKDSVSND